jgi:hypothetical protein
MNTYKSIITITIITITNICEKKMLQPNVDIDYYY